MFVTTGASVAGSFGGMGMSPETMAAMKLQISLMVADLPVEFAREMLQITIWQSTEVLKLMPPPEEIVPSVENQAEEKEVQSVGE